MLDGIPVYNADHLLGVFSIFTPEAVKNTTLFKVLFLPATAGVFSSIVDVRTNDGDMHKYHGAFSIGLLTDKLHIEGPIWKERTSFSFSARASPPYSSKNLIVDKRRHLFRQIQTTIFTTSMQRSTINSATVAASSSVSTRGRTTIIMTVTTTVTITTTALRIIPRTTAI